MHDVEKHLPALRALFSHVPFIPDWRIDDLMVSFAAPGGGVGPHRDNYDVFLCQGIGVREWRTTLEDPGPDTEASSDLALLHEFAGSRFEAREGDVLYLPPGVPHWGTAQRACMTYSIGMRAPQLADLSASLPDGEEGKLFYADADLSRDEVAPGRISRRAALRAVNLLGEGEGACDEVATALGRCVTTTKEWLTPEMLDDEDAESALSHLINGGRLAVHGMARIAWDAKRVYVNGRSHDYAPASRALVARICQARYLEGLADERNRTPGLVKWLLRAGAFETPGNL